MVGELTAATAAAAEPNKLLLDRLFMRNYPTARNYNVAVSKNI
jgi:hypothetical protein